MLIRATSSSLLGAAGFTKWIRAPGQLLVLSPTRCRSMGRPDLISTQRMMSGISSRFRRPHGSIRSIWSRDTLPLRRSSSLPITVERLTWRPMGRCGWGVIRPQMGLQMLSSRWTFPPGRRPKLAEMLGGAQLVSRPIRSLRISTSWLMGGRYGRWTRQQVNLAPRSRQCLALRWILPLTGISIHGTALDLRDAIG